MHGEIVGLQSLIELAAADPRRQRRNYIEAGPNVNSIVLQVCRPADCCTLSMMSRPIFQSNPKGSVIRYDTPGCCVAA